MIFLVNALSHLEMRKALAHVKSHLLSMASIILAYICMYNVLLKFFFYEIKLPGDFKLFSLIKKKVISGYCKVYMRIPRDLQTLVSIYVLHSILL